MMALSRKLFVFLCLVCFSGLVICHISPATAAEKGALFVSPLFKELGVKPDDMPESVMGTVEDPEKLIGLGLEGVVRGDGVELTDKGNGKINVRHVPTDNAIELHIK